MKPLKTLTKSKPELLTEPVNYVADCVNIEGPSANPPLHSGSKSDSVAPNPALHSDGPAGEPLSPSRQRCVREPDSSAGVSKAMRQLKLSPACPAALSWALLVHFTDVHTQFLLGKTDGGSWVHRGDSLRHAPKRFGEGPA